MSIRALARPLSLAAALLLAVAPAGASVARSHPAYQPASHYGATLEQSSGRWLLHALDGQDLVVSVPADCHAAARLPAGLWLVSRDEAGGLRLRAPSTTPLPAGHDGELAVRACDQAEGAALALPGQLIDWLAASTGAVWIDD